MKLPEIKNPFKDMKNPFGGIFGGGGGGGGESPFSSKVVYIKTGLTSVPFFSIPANQVPEQVNPENPDETIPLFDPGKFPYPRDGYVHPWHFSLAHNNVCSPIGKNKLNCKRMGGLLNAKVDKDLACRYGKGWDPSTVNNTQTVLTQIDQLSTEVGASELGSLPYVSSIANLVSKSMKLTKTISKTSSDVVGCWAHVMDEGETLDNIHMKKEPKGAITPTQAVQKTVQEVQQVQPTQQPEQQQPVQQPMQAPAPVPQQKMIEIKRWYD